MKKYNFGLLLATITVSGWMIAENVLPTKEIYSDILENQITEQREAVEIEKMDREIAQVIPLEKWTGGEITGIRGENDYTNQIKNSFVYGEVEEFLTFKMDIVSEESGAAFVAAGKQEEEGFFGSIWFVEKDKVPVMLEQYICITDREIQYQDMEQKKVIFLNYAKDGRNCGRVFLYQNMDMKEILKSVSGRKIANSDGSIVCMYSADDGTCTLETDVNTGKTYYRWEGYTEKPYTLLCYTNGAIREIEAKVVSREELLEYAYGESIIQKVEESYPQGIKQYIVRENGEVNVNIAVEEGDVISFFYMTFQTDKQGVEPKFGTGLYLLHMTGEKSWQEFLESFSGEKSFLPKEISVLPWYFDGEQIEDKLVEDRFWIGLDFEREEFGKENGIVGDVFTPEKELLERLSGFVPDYSEGWGDFYYGGEYLESGKISGLEREKEFCRRVKLLGKTDSFLLYVTNDDNTIILKTTDDIYLGANLYLYRPYMELLEEDFDQDGEVELMMLGRESWSASGVCIEHLYVADRDENSLWKIYELQPNWYRDELKKRYQIEYIDGLLNMVVDGEFVGVPVDVYKNKDYFGCSMDASAEFQIREGQVNLYAELKGFGPVHYSLGGNGMWMKIAYLGEGKWDVLEYDYYSSFLESYITYDVLLLMEEVKEIKEIQYDPILVRECTITEGSLRLKM